MPQVSDHQVPVNPKVRGNTPAPRASFKETSAPRISLEEARGRAASFFAASLIVSPLAAGVVGYLFSRELSQNPLIGGVGGLIFAIFYIVIFIAFIITGAYLGGLVGAAVGLLLAFGIAIAIDESKGFTEGFISIIGSMVVVATISGLISRALRGRLAHLIAHRGMGGRAIFVGFLLPVLMGLAVPIGIGVLSRAHTPAVKSPVSARAAVDSGRAKGQPAADGVVKAHIASLNVRSSPSPQSSVISILRAGDSVKVLDVKDGWFKAVLPDGKSGWVYGEYIILKR